MFSSSSAPLHPLVRSVTRQKIRRHLSLIHHLIRFARINPKEVKAIPTVRRSPGYIPAFDLVIPPSKDDALPFAIVTNTMALVHVYSDGSGFEGGIGASALLYINERLVKVLHAHL